MPRRRRGTAARALPSNCKFHAIGNQRSSQLLRAIASSRKLVDLARSHRHQPVWERERKAPAEEQGGAGLHSKTDGRTTKEEREARRDARGESTIQAQRSRRGGHRPVATRAPRRPIYARRRFGAAPRSVLCASFYLGGRGRNAAATPPASDAFIQLKWAAPPRKQKTSRRRPRSAIFESSSCGKGAVGSSARCTSC